MPLKKIPKNPPFIVSEKTLNKITMNAGTLSLAGHLIGQVKNIQFETEQESLAEIVEVSPFCHNPFCRHHHAVVGHDIKMLNVVSDLPSEPSGPPSLMAGSVVHHKTVVRSVFKLYGPCIVFLCDVCADAARIFK